jgi:hypothetical protein
MIDIFDLSYEERIARLASCVGEAEERTMLCLLVPEGNGDPAGPGMGTVYPRKTFADVLGALKWPANVMVLWERVGRGYIDDEFRKCPILPDELRALLGMIDVDADGTLVTIADWGDYPKYSKAKRVK